MPQALPRIQSIRDFYAFEQHVRTCRSHRGLDMIPQWYDVPVFYFSNANALVDHDQPVYAPQNSTALDYELEIAVIVGKAVKNLPDDDSALDCLAGITIYNDWSARDLQRLEMAVGLGPSKGKDFANSFGPVLLTLDEVADRYRNGRFELAMEARVNGKRYSQGNAYSMHWTWPQILAHASRDVWLQPGDAIGSGTVGTGCILELTPEAVGGWLQPGDLVELEVERIGILRNPVVENPHRSGRHP